MTRRNQDHDLLITLNERFTDMQGDMKFMREKVEYLFRVDPAGPLMQLSTHLTDHKQAKKRQATYLSLLAGSVGTVASWLYNYFFK